MSTASSSRIERAAQLLGAGLHEVDQVAIDVRRGRTRLARTCGSTVRRCDVRTVIAVAAAVIAVVVVARC
jgi:hypothetical protein